MAIWARDWMCVTVRRRVPVEFPFQSEFWNRGAEVRVPGHRVEKKRSRRTLTIQCCVRKMVNGRLIDVGNRIMIEAFEGELEGGSEGGRKWNLSRSRTWLRIWPIRNSSDVRWDMDQYWKRKIVQPNVSQSERKKVSTTNWRYLKMLWNLSYI